MAQTAQDIFKFFLVDEFGASYYVTPGGVIMRQMQPKPLQFAPVNWNDQAISYTRNMVYFGLDRTYSTEYKFVKDGAAILRWLLNALPGSGVESKVYLVVAKYEPGFVPAFYNHYYRAEIDLLQAVENENDVTVNTLEGEAMKALKTNENVQYEIPISDIGFPVRMVGVDLQDKFNWASYNFTIPSGFWWVFPLSYQNNEGDNVGVQASGQIPQNVPVVDLQNYYQNESGNSFMQVAYDVTDAVATGILKYTTLQTSPGGDPTDVYLIRSSDPWNSGDGSAWVHIGTFFDQGGETRTIDINETFDIPAGARVFLFMQLRVLTTGATHSIQVSEESKLSISLTTVAPTTTPIFITPLQLWQALCNKATDGKYAGVSQLLQLWEAFAVTSGMALRLLPNAVIKTSIKEFKQAYGSILGAAIGVRLSDQAILFERKEYFFDNTRQIADVGEVSELRQEQPADMYWRRIEVGYEDQQYNQRAGRYEFNSQQNYTTPGQRNDTLLDLKSPYRTDCYGIDFIRGELVDKNTTDNKGDNETFVVDVAKTFHGYIRGFDVIDSRIVLYGAVELLVEDFPDGSTFLLKNAPPPAPPAGVYAGYYRVISTVVDIDAQTLTITVDRTISDAVNVTAQFEYYTYIINRPGTATGVPTNSVYNTRLSPKNNLLRNGNFIRGAFFDMPGKLIQFQTALKNADLVTVLPTPLGTITTIEKSSPRISQLAAPFWKRKIFTFTTRVPQNIIPLLKDAGRGYITFKWKGVTLTGYPMDVSVKPAYRDAQEWRVLCTDLVDTRILETINKDVLQIEDMGKWAYLNPLHITQLNREYPLQYHFRHMDYEMHHLRIGRYAMQKPYFQKVQRNDAQTLQILTKSVSVFCQLHTCEGAPVPGGDITFTAVTNPRVTNPWVQWEGTINWSLFPEGTYYPVFTFGTGDEAEQYISEGIYLRDEWPETIRFDYKNSEDKDGVIFSTGYAGVLRIEGMIQKYNPEVRVTSYVDQNRNRRTLSSDHERTWELFIGGEFGMPDWLMDKVSRIILLDDFRIDGIRYTIGEDAEFEPRVVDGSPYAYWSIKIYEYYNRDGLPITGSGLQQTDLTVEYNIETRGFSSTQSPNSNQQSNIIQVIDVE